MRSPRIIKYSVFVLFVFLLVFGFHFRAENLKNAEQARLARDVYLQKEIQWKDLSSMLRAETKGFRGVSGIVVKDLDNGFVFQHNENELFPSASLAKIPVMAAVYKAVDEGNLDLEKGIVLKARDKLSGSGKLKNVAPGAVFSVEELVKLMVSISDNTATNMITNVLGMKYINISITEFGLNSSRLSRRVADYDARARGLENYTTAGDMALILEKMYRGELVSGETSMVCLDILLDQKSHDRIPKYLPKDVLVAHKTGLEKSVCHDAGIVFDPKGDFLICVLTKHANSNSLPSKKFIAEISLLVYNRHEIPVLIVSGETPNSERSGIAVTPQKLSIRKIQTFLSNIDLYRGAIDGKTGPQTRSSIRNFQIISGLTPDGIIGSKTLAAISEYPESLVNDISGSESRRQ